MIEGTFFSLIKIQDIKKNIFKILFFSKGTLCAKRITKITSSDKYNKHYNEHKHNTMKFNHDINTLKMTKYTSDCLSQCFFFIGIIYIADKQTFILITKTFAGNMADVDYWP